MKCNTENGERKTSERERGDRGREKDRNRQSMSVDVRCDQNRKKNDLNYVSGIIFGSILFPRGTSSEWSKHDAITMILCQSYSPKWVRFALQQEKPNANKRILIWFHFKGSGRKNKPMRDCSEKVKEKKRKLCHRINVRFFPSEIC